VCVRARARARVCVLLYVYLKCAFHLMTQVDKHRSIFLSIQ